jgi:Glyoxalase-like domain
MRYSLNTLNFMRTSIAALDHLVLGTPDLVDTARWIEERTGVTPSPGGQHIGRGTRNVLCSLGASSYLEIIGPDPDQPTPADPRPFNVDQLTEPTMVAWAIAVPDMDIELATSRARGYDPGPATPMQRQRPDGVMLSWTLTAPTSIALPFLIDWGNSLHPATTAAPGLELVELQASHPAPGPFAETLAVLGVTMGTLPGREMLIVELRGPLGTITFPSVDGVFA